MIYTIKTLAVKQGRRTIIEESGVVKKGVPTDRVETTLHSLPSLNGFSLTADLPIPLKANVVRIKPGREIVRLENSEKRVDLLRRAGFLRDERRKPDYIGASCSPYGDEVPVKTLNLPFRDLNDLFTDRGLVWVTPGNPATMSFIIKYRALDCTGRVTTIVVAAERIVNTKLLVYFLP